MSNVNYKRLYWVDLMRIIAALCVVIFHYNFSYYKMEALPNCKLCYISKFGYLGVNMFFILSGYVMFFSIRHFSISKYIISRISRLYPTYWLCVSLTTLCIYFLSKGKSIGLVEYFMNLTMIQSVFGYSSVDGVYWTLLVELKFYIFVVLLYLLVNAKKSLNIRWIYNTWLFLSVLALFYDNKFFSILDIFLEFQWSSYFIAGMALYGIQNNSKKLYDYSSYSLSLVLSIYTATARGSENILTVAIIIIFIYGILLTLSHIGERYLRFKWLAMIGSLTYPLYLIHQEIGYLILDRLDMQNGGGISVLFLIIVMLCASWVIYFYYERHIVNKMKNFLTVKLRS